MNRLLFNSLANIRFINPASYHGLNHPERVLCVGMRLYHSQITMLQGTMQPPHPHHYHWVPVAVLLIIVRVHLQPLVQGHSLLLSVTVAQD